MFIWPLGGPDVTNKVLALFLVVHIVILEVLGLLLVIVVEKEIIGGFGGSLGISGNK